MLQILTNDLLLKIGSCCSNLYSPKIGNGVFSAISEAASGQIGGKILNVEFLKWAIPIFGGVIAWLFN